MRLLDIYLVDCANFFKFWTHVDVAFATQIRVDIVLLWILCIWI